MAKKKRPFERAVAVEMWTHDGKPDGHAPTESNESTYEGWTAEVFGSLERLGLKVVRA